ARDVEEWATGPLDLAIDGRGVPLAVLAAFDDQIRRADGFLTIRGGIAGPVTEPYPEDLEVAIVDGLIEYTGTQVRYHDVQLAGRLDREEVALERLSIFTAPMRWDARTGLLSLLPGEQQGSRPNIVLRGAVGLDGYTLGDATATIVLDRAWILALPDELLQVSGSIRLGGGFPQLRLAGDLSVDRAFLGIDAAQFLQVAPLRTDPTLVIHRPGRTVEAPEPEADPEPPIWEQFEVDVDVSLGRNVELQATVPYIEN